MSFCYIFMQNNQDLIFISHHVKYVFVEKCTKFSYAKHVWEKLHLLRFSIWGISDTCLKRPQLQMFLERLDSVSALPHFSWEDIGEGLAFYLSS